MTPTERAQVWQQHMTDWEVSRVSGSAYPKCPLCDLSVLCFRIADRVTPYRIKVRFYQSFGIIQSTRPSQFSVMF
jgi:hypothetical protein